MNKHAWLLSLLIALLTVCLGAPCAHAKEETAAQSSLRLAERIAKGNLGKNAAEQAMLKAGESDYPPFFGDDNSPSQQGSQPEAQNPAPAQQGGNWGSQPAAPSIDGTWSDGAIILVFQAGQYQVARGGQVIESGAYRVVPNAVQFLPAGMGPYSKQFRMDAQAIYLDNQRYARQGGGGGNWGNSAPQGGSWGNSPSAQDNTWWGSAAPSRAPTRLEGCWISTNLPARMRICFQGNRYRATLDNPPVEETGTFAVEGNKMHINVLTGSDAGKQATNRFALGFNTLTMTYSNGLLVTFHGDN